MAEYVRCKTCKGMRWTDSKTPEPCPDCNPDGSVVPVPGSEAAFQQGCKCARGDNAYGLGSGYKGDNGEPLFWISSDCTMHAAKEETADVVEVGEVDTQPGENVDTDGGS
jgi:hypothetical protein